MNKKQLWMDKFEMIKSRLTKKQQQLALAGFQQGMIDEQTALEFYTTRHHYVNVMRRLCALGLFYADYGSYKLDYTLTKDQVAQRRVEQYANNN